MFSSVLFMDRPDEVRKKQMQSPAVYVPVYMAL